MRILELLIQMVAFVIDARNASSVFRHAVMSEFAVVTRRFFERPCNLKHLRLWVTSRRPPQVCDLESVV